MITLEELESFKEEMLSDIDNALYNLECEIDDKLKEQEFRFKEFGTDRIIIIEELDCWSDYLWDILKEKYEIYYRTRIQYLAKIDKFILKLTKK